jgi:two-component system, OmpR family, response regulator
MQSLRSVLYVDDDPDICAVVAATLKAIADIGVHAALSGEAAIELARELMPDLILMDVMMPGLDGPSTLIRMRGYPAIAGIPVIFLTAKVLPTEVAQLLKMGAIGVIGKPFDPTRLCGDILSLWKSVARVRALQETRGIAAVLPEPSQAPLPSGFLERARDDVVRLRQMLRRIVPGDRRTLEEMERVAHSIHGAAAMFGFPPVSSCGGALESLVERVKGTASMPDPATLRLLVERTERLAEAVEAAWRGISAGAPARSADAASHSTAH